MTHISQFNLLVLYNAPQWRDNIEEVYILIRKVIWGGGVLSNTNAIRCCYCMCDGRGLMIHSAWGFTLYKAIIFVLFSRHLSPYQSKNKNLYNCGNRIKYSMSNEMKTISAGGLCE